MEDVKYDESADAYSISVGIRVDNENGTFIGVMKVVLNIEGVINVVRQLQLDQARGHYKTIQFHLMTEDGRLIYSPQGTKPLEDVSHLLANVQHSEKEDSNHLVTQHYQTGMGRVLSAYARSGGYGDFKGLGWTLIVDHAREEILRPVTELKDGLLTMLLIATVFAVLIGFVLSRSIIGPVLRLRGAAIEIGKGRLDTRIEVES